MNCSSGGTVGILLGKGEDALALLGCPTSCFAELSCIILTFPAAITEGGQVAVPGRIPRWARQVIFRCFLKAQGSAGAPVWGSGLGIFGTLRCTGDLGGGDDSRNLGIECYCGIIRVGKVL